MPAEHAAPPVPGVSEESRPGADEVGCWDGRERSDLRFQVGNVVCDLGTA